MGEFVGVLNGVEFRTRHNDYRLKMPSTTSTDWHATEDIPFPDVPPEVGIFIHVFKFRNQQSWIFADHMTYTC